MATHAADSNALTAQRQSPAPGSGSTFSARTLPTRFDRFLLWAALLLAAAVILLHAGLIAGAYWDGDEFFNLGHYRQAGLQFLFFRIENWSPWRSLSEVTLYFYFLAAQLAHAQLIAAFLTGLWALLVGAAIFATWRQDSARSPYRLTLGLSLVAMFLLDHRINEMFYWPMAAAPYLQALAGLVIATFQILLGETALSRGRLISGIAISEAVLSSETGLFFALGLGGTLCLLELPGVGPGGMQRLRRAGWYLVPLALGLAELVLTFLLRINQTTAGLAPTDTYFHHAWPSLLAALRTLPRELAWTEPSSLAASLALKALLLLGFVGVWSNLPAVALRRSHVLALAAGLLSVMVLIIFASFYQYGGWGFERHRTFLQCLFVLLLLVIARALAAAWPLPVGVAVKLGPICLLGAMALGLAPRLPGVLDDYALIPQIRAARFATWDSGNQPGPAMRFVMPPHGHVLTGMVWQTGHFSTGDANLPWYVPGLLNCFGKTSVEIVQYDAAGKGH
jgi:hypothetical protein